MASSSSTHVESVPIVKASKANVIIPILVFTLILIGLGLANWTSQTPLDQPNLVMIDQAWAPGQGHNTASEYRLGLITPEEEASIQFDYVFLVSNPTFSWEQYLQVRPGDVIYDRRDREFWPNPANEFVDVVVYSSAPPPTKEFLESLQ